MSRWPRCKYILKMSMCLAWQEANNFVSKTKSQVEILLASSALHKCIGEIIFWLNSVVIILALVI